MKSLNMASQDEEEKICESCNKSFSETTLLKHIGNRKVCESHYGSRFKEMKKKQATERKAKYRHKMS